MSQHYVPNEKFSNAVSIINKIAYHAGNATYEPIESITIDRMIDNLSQLQEQKERLTEILKAKEDDEKNLQNHLSNLYNA